MYKMEIAAIIEALEEVQRRPLMWMGELTGIMAFLNGFNAACYATVYKNIRDDFFEKVVNERGWHISSHGPQLSMREKGLSENEIVNELLTIQIEVWKRRHDSIDAFPAVKTQG